MIKVPAALCEHTSSEASATGTLDSFYMLAGETCELGDGRLRGGEECWSNVLGGSILCWSISTRSFHDCHDLPTAFRLQAVWSFLDIAVVGG